jgi:hypothetical protein
MTDDEILALYREKTNNPYQHARRDASTGTTPSPSQRGDLDRRRFRSVSLPDATFDAAPDERAQEVPEPQQTSPS